MTQRYILASEILLGDGLTIDADGALAATGGAGTVTSVGLSAPAIFDVAGSPITTSGDIALTLANQSANLVWAGPTSGGAAAPTFRALVDADIPSSIARDSEIPASLPPTGAAGGDLSGTYPNPTVAKIQGRAVHTAAPAANDVLTWDNANSRWAPAAEGHAGTVTSVALTVPGIMSVAGSPITTSGTLTVTLANQSANLVWAGPTTGSAAAPTFRALVDADIPASIARDSEIPTSLPPSGSAGGDLSGTYPNPTVAKIQGRSVHTAAPNDGDALLWVSANSRYEPLAVIQSMTLTDDGTILQASVTTPAPNLAVGFVLRTQAANKVLAGPTSGSAAAPTFRSLVANDIPNLSAGKITSGQLAQALGGTGADLSATGGAGQYLKQSSAGAAISVGTIPFSDLTYSGLTTGQVPRATSATAVAFGALDLANTSAVTGILGAANGGTGVNNAGTLTNASNTTITGGGTLALAGFTLTVPASGTAALRASAATAGRIAFWSDANSVSHSADLTYDNSSKLFAATGIARFRTTASGNGYGIRLWDGTNDFGSWQALDLSSATYLFFSTNRQYDGSAWQQLNTRAGASLQISTDDTLVFSTFPAASSTPTTRWRIGNVGNMWVGKGSGLTGTGDLDVAGVISGDAHIRLSEISTPAAPGANQGVIYLDDNGAGKTRLMIRFNTGSAVQIAIQP